MAEIGLFEAMYSARAIRRLKPDPVPNDVLTKVLDAAIRAPSGSNNQNWIFVVVKDAERRKKLSDIYRRGGQLLTSIYQNRKPPEHMTEKQQARLMASAMYLFEHMDEVPVLLLACLRKAYPAIPRNWTSSFGGIKDEAYLGLLRQTIIAESDPENVVLLEIEPEKQKTRVDFAATERLLGIRAICVTKIKKRDRKLFYDRDGRAVRIERIYNRVIFDELVRRPDLDLAFRFQDDLDVTWVGHPNWYFRVSKHSLPFLKTAYTSPAFFADEFPADADISNYVLKPLYSFAGHGVDMEPTRQKIGALEKPHDWILQKKIDYATFVPTVNGQKSKAEIRMMFVWPDKDPGPTLVNNLVRMSQGKMMGVDFNIDKTWVGASIALHEG